MTFLPARDENNTIVFTCTVSIAVQNNEVWVLKTFITRLQLNWNAAPVDISRFHDYGQELV